MKFKLTLVGTLAVATILTTTLAQAYTPTTNNLVLWLKPDTLSLSNGDPVSLWSDSSASANNASQATAANQPSFVANFKNGNGAVRFGDADTGAATADWMGLATRQTLPGGLTYIAVFSTTSTSSSRSYEGNAANTIFGDQTGAAVSSFGVTGGKVELMSWSNAWSSTQGTTSVADGLVHVAIATFATSEILNANIYVDGLLQTTASRGYRGDQIGINRLSGGYAYGGPGGLDTFDGDISQALIYDRVLSATERQDAYEYFVSTYALPEPSSALLLLAGAVLLWRKRSQ